MNLHEVYLAAQLAKNDNSGTEVDLSEYYIKSQIDSLISSKVDKVSGMGLSTNDFMNADKSKLDGLSNYDDTEVKAEIVNTVEQTALNRSTLGYQRKNLLMNNCRAITKNGVTATVNADGSISLSGSNTFGSPFMIYANLQTGAATGQYVDNKKFLPNGKYILSGSKSGVNLQVRLAEIENSEGELVASSNGGETAFTVTDAHKYVWSRILIRTNADFGEGITIYPMIRSAEITDDTYEPYRPSIEERLTA
ncbi:MAG: hypothetical protein K2J47_10985, partial [Ruminococcus sp.]|nr:hypothetical protein [Ruminococcus sp.]